MKIFALKKDGCALIHELLKFQWLSLAMKCFAQAITLLVSYCESSNDWYLLQVGSCAQIGKNVHLSGGVGIGGVLEPLQASPVNFIYK